MSRPPRHDPPPPDETGEYASLGLGSSWGTGSLLLFVLAVASRQLVRWLPPHLQGWDLMPPVAVLLVPPLALIGLLLGLVGVRRKDHRRTLALVGAGLNGLVLLLSVALLIGFWWVRMR